MCNGCDISWWFYIGPFLAGVLAWLFWYTSELDERESVFRTAFAFYAVVTALVFLTDIAAVLAAGVGPILGLLAVSAVLCFLGVSAAGLMADRFYFNRSRYRVNR